MVATKREKIIGLVTAGVIGLFALDRAVLTPLVDRRARVEAESETARVEMERAEQLFNNGPRMNQRWKDMVSAGLKPAVSEAEGQAMRALHNWAQDAGLKLTTLNPDRVEPLKKQPEFQQVMLRAVGAGSMGTISRFLWRIQTAEIPMRVTTLEINAHKDGTDELVVNVSVSTLVLSPTPAKPVAVGPGAVAMLGSQGEGR